MPDFDKRKIPTLDDVIEIADNEKIDFNLSIDSDEMLDAESYSTETNVDLFESEIIDLTTEDSSIAGSGIADSSINIDETTIIEDTINSETDPQIGTIDNINNEDEIDGIESALINYNITDEDKAEPSTIDSSVIEEPGDTTHRQAVEVEPQTTTLSLQSVTDDIVKQLMPELEQQLRLLLEQALKEKLSKEIIQSLSAEISSASNK